MWTLRILTACALGVGLFLVSAHVMADVAQKRISVAYCQLLNWFDCDTVLNSDWATVFSVPVSVLGSIVYAAMLTLLFLPLRRMRVDRALRLWWLLFAMSVAVAGAAGWFIYLQVFRLDRICLWCMTEHAMGVTLFLLIFLHGYLAGALGGFRLPLGLIAGLIPVGLLIAGQHWDTHEHYAMPVPVTGIVDEYENYSEIEADAAFAVKLRGDLVTLNRLAHPLLGESKAKYVMVEIIDYTCPKCERVYRMWKDIKPDLGDDYAVLVITNPLSHKCNPRMSDTEPRHLHACMLARLAHAVWFIDPAKFQEMHDYLFTHQAQLRGEPDRARQFAAQLVGSELLEDALANEKVDQLLKRDVKIAGLLGVRQLPGLFAGKMQFTYVPDEAKDFERDLRRAFEQTNALDQPEKP